jgi:hypothetical protein
MHFTPGRFPVVNLKARVQGIFLRPSAWIRQLQLRLGCQQWMVEGPESVHARCAIHLVSSLPTQGKMFYK